MSKRLSSAYPLLPRTLEWFSAFYAKFLKHFLAAEQHYPCPSQEPSTDTPTSQAAVIWLATAFMPQLMRVSQSKCEQGWSPQVAAGFGAAPGHRWTLGLLQAGGREG